MANALESYTVEADNLKIQVNIVQSPGQLPLYELVVPALSSAMVALLDDIRHSLITEVNVSASEILDPTAVMAIKKKFNVRSDDILSKKLPHLDIDTRNFLVGMLMHEMMGLGKVEFLLNDGNLEEVVINSSREPVRVYHKKYGWLITNVFLSNEAQIQNYANIIARRVGRQITTLNPLLDAHLVTGDRANAVLYPISTKGDTITIRKFVRDPWTVTDFIANKTSTPSNFALIWLAVQYEMNMLISGGTASGKTSFLNVCMPFIPPNHRVISIEDTRELQLPEYLYWCPLTTREPNPEGKGEITMLDLLINSLRMRPDRIILGEMRTKEAAQVLFEAMHTGHSVYATVHADSINETIQRLVHPPLDISPNLLSAVNLNVVMFRDRRQGIRRTFQIGEFITTEESGNVTAKANILYRWKAGTDTMVKHSESLRLFEELSRHTGMSHLEIEKDLQQKEKLLNWLVKNKVRGIQNIGKIMHQYYIGPDMLLDAVNKNQSPDKILK